MYNLLSSEKDHTKRFVLPYSLYYSPDSIRVLSRIQSRKLKLLFSKKWQKLEYNPAQKIQKINRVPDCNTDFTVYSLAIQLQFLDLKKSIISK